MHLQMSIWAGQKRLLLVQTIQYFWQEHVEGYHELSAKTKIFFATAVSLWDADYYVKVDDDVHVNLGDMIVIE